VKLVVSSCHPVIPTLGVSEAFDKFAGT